MKILAIIFACATVTLCDTSITVNLRSSINEISDKFISYDIDFNKLTSNISLLSPSYVKLRDFLNFIREHGDSKKDTMISIFQSFHRNRITPVIVVDYNISTFDPLALLQDMKRANELGVMECVWQLGSPSSLQLSDNESLKKYSDDLKTLRILCESVKRGSKSQWNVAAAAGAVASENATPTLAALDYGVFSQAEVLSAKIPRVLSSEADAWATIEMPLTRTKKGQGLCDENCVINGLFYANTLGEAAKKGFDVLFLDNEIAATAGQMQQEDGFRYVINKLHNALIGTKVFNVRAIKSANKMQSSVYAYCAKKMNGGVTMMGINYSNTRVKINSKFLSSMDSSSVVSQYLLSVADGVVMLNNERYNGTLNAAHKFKKISRKHLDLTIPPFSIVFWVIKNANAKECIDIESNQVRQSTTVSSSSDKLLKTLAASAIGGTKNRIKRQFPQPSLFPKLDLKFTNLVPSNINQRSIKDVLFNKNTEIYKVAPTNDHNPLVSSENPSLPEGDVYIVLNDGKNDYVDAEIEYPIARKSPRKLFQQQRKLPRLSKFKEDSMPQESEAHEFYVSQDYEEKSPSPKKTVSTKKTSKVEPQEIGELFEKEIVSSNYGRFNENDQQMRDSGKNVEIKTVMRELEPTVRQSKKAILAAKKKWSQDQLMDLLKDATLEEVNRSEIKNVDDFKVIDLTNDEEPDYAEYDDDEDGFFSDKGKVRSRRAAVDYTKNEIPRDGDHYVDDDEEDLSIENFANLYLLPPRYEQDNLESGKLMTSTLKETAAVPAEGLATTEASNKDSMGIRIIDVFSNSVDDVVNIVHKNLRTLWSVFSNPEYY